MHRPPSAALTLDSLPGKVALRPDAARRLRCLFDENFELVGRVVRNLGVPVSEVDDVLERVFSSAAARLDDIDEGCERRMEAAHVDLDGCVPFGAEGRHLDAVAGVSCLVGGYLRGRVHEIERSSRVSEACRDLCEQTDRSVLAAREPRPQVDGES